ncbi:hypothetical protein Ngar_c24930 [Candidatus Nitrososphaera gargensis Ga9.2]|uniref:Uncharacterized protein n=1 Tax=Nitrososphaera gargensis (strain Ga9.2) TaxID=1237085 RepID=K0IHJ6_NITGG|nr:hypothetical protein [Candidatus Nitrososphaera gargensis]AFU59415.1 hypothetical protein Ngar_c24930 [Candidatus Nitrososphaera gargensis Ga9.2]
MSEQPSILASQVRRHGITGIAIHLAGFAIGFVSTGLVLQGVIGIEAGTTVLTPFADLLYGLGLVIVVAVAARAGVPMKYLAIAGAVIGVGLFYRGQPHEIHIASGIGFGITHPAHIGLGHLLMTVSAAALAALAFVLNRFRREDRK